MSGTHKVKQESNEESPTTTDHYVSLELAISIVPNFNSKDNELIPFVEQCRSAESFVRPEQRPFFTLLVRSKKIKGVARGMLDLCRETPRTIDELVAALQKCFPRVFNVGRVYIELIELRQEKRETAQCFAARIGAILRRGLVASVESDIALSRADFTKMVVNQFRRGLRDRQLACFLDENKMDLLDMAKIACEFEVESDEKR